MGSGTDAHTLISSTGLIGSTANPAYLYGYTEGAFIGNAAFPVSTVSSTALDSVPSGHFQFFLLSSGALVVKTSTGVLGTIPII